MMKEVFNGSHFEESKRDYFEWWYMHFVTENGRHFNVVLHETDIFGLKPAPYTSVSFTGFDGQEKHLKGVISPGDIGRHNDLLRVRGGLINETERELKLSLNFGGNVKFDGAIEKLSSPLVINNGVMVEDSLGRTSSWVVQIPYGSFEGIFQEGDERQNLSGMAYQDHQWGDLRIQEFVSDWIWGHFSNKDLSVVFFRVLTQDGRLIDRSALISAGGSSVTRGLETPHFDALISSITPEYKFIRGGANFVDEGCELSFSLDRRKLMRSRIGEKGPGFNATYLRWGVQADLNLGTSAEQLQGITEYLRIRK